MFNFDWFGLKHKCIGKQSLVYHNDDGEIDTIMHVYFFKNKFGSKYIKYDAEYDNPTFLENDSKELRKILLRQHPYYHDYIQPWLNDLIEDDELFFNEKSNIHKEGNVIYLNNNNKEKNDE